MRARRKAEDRKSRGWAAKGDAMAQEVNGAVKPPNDSYGKVGVHFDELGDEEVIARLKEGQAFPSYTCDAMALCVIVC